MYTTRNLNYIFLNRTDYLGMNLLFHEYEFILNSEYYLESVFLSRFLHNFALPLKRPYKDLTVDPFANTQQTVFLRPPTPHLNSGLNLCLREIYMTSRCRLHSCYASVLHSVFYLRFVRPLSVLATDQLALIYGRWRAAILPCRCAGRHYTHTRAGVVLQFSKASQLSRYKN